MDSPTRVKLTQKHLFSLIEGNNIILCKMLSTQKRLFIFLIAGFVVFTIIGTLTHELGHYGMSRFLGYEAEITYAYTFLENADQIPLGDRFWITLGGPAETMVTGTIGFLLLTLYGRAHLSSGNLSVKQWLLIFISLFWLRQAAVFFMLVAGYFFTGHLSQTQDEIKIALYWKLPELSVSAFTAIIGIIVLAVLIFKYIPARERFTFCVAGLIGGIFGFILWFKLLGEFLMP